MKILYMKATFVVLLSLVVLAQGPRALAVEPHDYRIINNQTVDIQPLRDWYQNRVGQRPFRAWKPWDILGVVDTLGTWKKCYVRDEHGRTAVIYVKHLPSSLVKYFSATEALDRQILALSGTLNYQNWQIDSAPLSKQLILTSGTLNPGHNNPGSSAQNRQALQTLLAKRAALNRVAQLQYIRYTGIKCCETQIWDCGTRGW
jgi:hypothetical protein